jgi:hypothetical protein
MLTFRWEESLLGFVCVEKKMLCERKRPLRLGLALTLTYFGPIFSDDPRLLSERTSVLHMIRLRGC